MKTFKTFVDESLVRQQEELEENYRSLAQKGIGAETKGSIKVGHGVDYYHPKNGDKHMGKIHSMSDSGYVVKDDKTGEKHSFDYFRKEEVEIEGSELDEDEYKGKRYGHMGIKIKSEKHYHQLVQADKDRAEKRRKEDQETGRNEREPAMTKQEYEKQHKELQAKRKEHQRKIDMGHYGESVELDEGLEKVVLNFMKKHGIDADFRSGKLIVDKEDMQKAKAALAKSDGDGFSAKAIKIVAEPEETELEEAAKSKLMMGSKVSHPVHGKGTVVRHSLGGGTTGTVVKFADGSKKTVNHKQLRVEEAELEEVAYTGKGNHRPGWMLRADPELAKKFKEKEDIAKKRQAAYGNPAAGKSVKEESELEEADFSKSQTTMAHAIGKHFKKKGIGDESKGGPYAIASAMVRDKPDAAKKAYATIKAKMKNEDHQDMLMALYDELSEENQEAFEAMLDSSPDKLLSFAQSHFGGE